jgi:protein-S-isoprenylcysteine O-methyltransferase Ste14
MAMALPIAWHLAASTLFRFGSALAVFALTTAGCFCSLMAEARQLVTCGPYRVIRYPLYLAEAIATIETFCRAP